MAVTSPPRRQGTAPPAPAPSSSGVGFRGRAAERALLLWNAPVVLLAAWGVAAGQPRPGEAFVPVVMALGAVWAACLALHLVFCATGFDGDLLILPLLSLLFVIAAAYHIGMAGALTGGPYARAVFAALVVLALITTGGRWFKRLNYLVEEKVWWRVAGDRPYYESAPFHILILGLMLLLALLLAVHGIRSQGGALVQVPLPGGLTFTPSEFIRLAVAFFLADYLGRNSRVLRNLRQPVGRVWPLNRLHVERRAELTVVLVTVGLYCLFFYVFHDLGPAAVIIALTLATLYVASGRVLTPLVLGVAIGLLIAIPTWKNVGFHTLHDRLEMWVSPWDTHFVGGDHQARILWSIASGGWCGLGLGTYNLPRTLPLAQNDAAFAGIAATMGLWTGLALLAVFAGITWRGMLAARQAPTDRMRLLGFCLTGLLGLQAVWICGAMVRVFPFTGINLPFVSTGITSMLASAVALGTVWNVSRSRNVRPDSSEATPEVLRGVTRLASPMMALFVLPALGLVIYGCPWLLGDRTLVQAARAPARGGERAAFPNPYLEKFRARFARGRILSADGKLMAVSHPTAEDVRAIREVSPAFAAKIERQEKNGDEGERYYPVGAAAAQLVGWTTQGRFAAQSGSVETAWDGALRGYREQQLPFYFRTRNNPLVRPPQPQDLQLTVRADLQEFAGKALGKAVKRWGGAGGALIVYDVSTGEVLAAATAPSFDPNGLSLERMERYVAQNPRTQVLTNKALARDALYFPGSTFKILTAAAAMDAVVSGSVTCRGGHNAEPITWEHHGKRWRRAPGKVHDFERSGHGTLSLSGDVGRALAVSCNVFFGKLATEVGADRLHQAMKDAELKWIPKPDQLAEHLPYAGFGQIDVKTSPLEMAMLAGAAGAARDDVSEAYTARPHWVQAVIRNGTSHSPEEGVPGAPTGSSYRPFPFATAQRLRRMMVGVVDDPAGTAHGAFFRRGGRLLPGITVGGKTGTAEFDKKGGRVGRHAWFVGFARSDHDVQPRTIAYAILVEDVRKGATGGQVCAPVAEELIRQILPLPGRSAPGLFGGIGRYYQEHIHRGLAGQIIDWFGGLFRHR